eukprot:7793521-Pyramimonas_sp.AAC.1
MFQGSTPLDGQHNDHRIEFMCNAPSGASRLPSCLPSPANATASSRQDGDGDDHDGDDHSRPALTIRSGELRLLEAHPQRELAHVQHVQPHVHPPAQPSQSAQ